MQMALNKITTAMVLALVISLGVSLAFEAAELTYIHEQPVSMLVMPNHQ